MKPGMFFNTGFCNFSLQIPFSDEYFKKIIFCYYFALYTIVTSITKLLLLGDLEIYFDEGIYDLKRSGSPIAREPLFVCKWLRLFIVVFRE